MAAKKKTHSYLVYFINKDMVSVEINAVDEETAKEKAKAKVEKVYSNPGLDVVDGSTTFAGILLNDEWSKLDN